MHTSFAVRALSAFSANEEQLVYQGDEIGETYASCNDGTYDITNGIIAPCQSHGGEVDYYYSDHGAPVKTYDDPETFVSDHDNSPTPCGWSYSENGGYTPCPEGYTCQSDPNIPDAAYCVEDEDEGWPDPRPDIDYGDDVPEVPIERYYDTLVGTKGHEGIDYAASDVTTILLTNQPVYADPMVKDAPLKDFYNTGTTGEDNFVPLLGEQPQSGSDGDYKPIEMNQPINPCAGTRCIALYKPCPEGYIDGNKCCPNTGNCIPDPNYVGTIKPALPIGQTPSTQFDQTTPIAIAQQTYANTPIATRGDSSGFTGTDTTILRNTTTPVLTETPTTAPVAAVKKDSPLAIAALLFLAFEVLG